MKKGWMKLIAVMLVAAFAVTLLPSPGREALAVGAYGKATADGVKVRKQPSTSAAYWFKIDNGYVCELLGTEASGGITWYKVNVVHPDPNSTRTYIGYIHGDFFTPLTAEEAAAWEQNHTQPGTAVSTPMSELAANIATVMPNPGVTLPPNITPGPSTGDITAGYGAMGQITNDGVNFRETEGGKVICKLNRDTVVELLTIPSVIDEAHWYRVRYNGVVGYIQAPFIRVITTGGAVTQNPSGGANYGYVRLILSSANLRVSPGGRVATRWENPGETLAVVGPTQRAEGYIWYPVYYSGKTYYVRADCVELVGSPNPGTATATPAPASVVGYVRTTEHNVNLRLRPFGETIQQVPKGQVVPCLAPVTNSGGFGWYYVQVGNVRGYLRGDCVKVCNADGSDLNVATVPPAETTAYGYVQITAQNTNLRNKPAGSSMEQLKKGTIVPMTGQPVKSGAYTWYPVRSTTGRSGYVRGDCAVRCNADGSAWVDDGTTPVPGTPVNPPVQSGYGYVMITAPKTNLRKTAGGTTIAQLDAKTVWPMRGNTVTAKGYVWYPITVNGQNGFVRNDCVYQLTAEQVQAYLTTGALPTVTDGTNTTVQYVITTMDSVNLRASASKDATALFNVPLGTVMAYNTVQTVGGAPWYRVIYQNTEVWVLGSCVRVMSTVEYQQWLATQPVATPQPEVIKGYLRTTASGVNLRSTAAGSKILRRIDKGVILPYLRDPESAKGYNWYYVRTADNVYGYLRDDFIELTNADGSTAITPPPQVTTNPSSGQEATYKTLRRGSKGTAVKNMVTELKKLGYYTGAITSTFTSAVEAAVKLFQQVNGLVVDGIAGPNTLHKLYGTVPVGQGNFTNLDMTLYPAEKIDWYTGGIQQLWAKGANFKVYDVKTGIVWWAHRWSGGSHVDAEPLTAADTSRLCKMYGVSSADEITSKKHWQRRPSLVTIGSRTFACSLYGVPHNYPDGDTISTNNFKGQLCIHFTNSKTHGTNHVDSYHQEAIQYAWEHAPNGHK